jgi:hypothetical protein
MTENLMQYREQAANALYPFIASGVDWDESLGKAVAFQAIDGYAPKTPREIQLSAQILACSFATICCVRSAMAAKNLSVEAVLNLQEAALALDEEAHRSTVALEAKQRERQRAPQVMTRDSVAWDHAAFNKTMNIALKRMRDADSKIADMLPKRTPAPPTLHVAGAEPMTTSVLALLAGYTAAGAKPKGKGFKPRIVT